MFGQIQGKVFHVAFYNISSKISMVVTFGQEAMLGKFENFCGKKVLK